MVSPASMFSIQSIQVYRVGKCPQTHIFNFFPGSIHSSRILKTLSPFASRQKNSYIPNQQIWLNRLYFQISNSKEKKCLTIDTREINELGPGKFRTDAQDALEQTCYFNRNKSNSHFTSYIAKRLSPENHVFYISKLNLDFNLDNKSLEIELKNLVANGSAKRQYQSINNKNTENGTKSSSARSETDQKGAGRGGDRLDSSLHAESAISRGGGGDDGKHREGGRKKPRYLSS